MSMTFQKVLREISFGLIILPENISENKLLNPFQSDSEVSMCAPFIRYPVKSTIHYYQFYLVSIFQK
ncbi:hypothetical protein EYC84_000283 [Monilinia fructicola]|uniref:Uncharacterized protein n=1 Tax=Monilinia fructicola TaxID=38448 RepID=A0A5M9JSS6_MONFR|nr:hypothetical protein EYC84_000283 [Monilinia fructicola]